MCTVCSCRPLSHFSIVFFKISSCKDFPLVWEHLCAANAQKIHGGHWETWAQGPALRASRASFWCKPAWDTSCLTRQRKQEVSCAHSPHTDSSTREKQALKLWCLCLAQVGGTEGGLIVLLLLQDTTKKSCDRCSPILLTMLFGQNYSTISFSREVWQNTGISEWPFSQTVVFLLGKAYSNVWGKQGKQQHRFACPQLLARSSSSPVLEHCGLFTPCTHTVSFWNHWSAWCAECAKQCNSCFSNTSCGEKKVPFS